MRNLFVWLLLCTAAAPGWLLAGDWPQFLGPNRNGAIEGDILPWSSTGPTQVWTLPVGQGFSGPVVSGGRLVIFHRKGNEEVLECVDAKNGSNHWQYSYPTKYRDDFGFDEGPRATPAISGDAVYSYGADGMVSAVDFASGKKLWAVDARTQYGARKGFFGRASSPLVEGELVILNIGGRDGAGIIALDKTTGKLRWKATEEEASYSSPVAGEIGEVRQILVLARNALFGLSPEGKVLFQHPFKPGVSASVTAATPLIWSNQVFLTASYDTGALLLNLENGRKPEKIWGGDDLLSSHYATPVKVQDNLYGFDGRQEYGAALTCVSWNDGKVKWRNERFGSGTITAVGNKLLLMMETGELILAAASGEKFEELARQQVLGSTGRAYPAFADGMFYSRDKTQLVCIKMGQPGAELNGKELETGNPDPTKPADPEPEKVTE